MADNFHYSADPTAGHFEGAPKKFSLSESEKADGVPSGGSTGVGGGGGGIEKSGSVTTTSTPPPPSQGGQAGNAANANAGGAPPSTTPTPGSTGGSGQPTSGGGRSKSSNADWDTGNSKNYTQKNYEGDGNIELGKSTKYPDNINTIIGLPPTAYWDNAGVYGEDAKVASGVIERNALAVMGIMELYPGYPKFGVTGSDGKDEAGLQLYRVAVGTEQAAPGKDGSLMAVNDRYKQVLSNAGFENFSNSLAIPIKIAFQNDMTVSESWQSDYGETDFENTANGAESSMLQQLRAITGASSGSQAIADATAGLTQGGGLVKGVTGALGTAASAGVGALEWAGGKIGGAAAMKLLSGSKVDFPMIWKSSSYQPSYSFTIRLYNPNPSSPDSYERFILFPLCQLIAFTVPLSDSPYTYNFPFLCKAKCPGLFNIQAGYVSSIDALKGGEGGGITFQHQPSIVDVKFTISDLYSTMIDGDPEDMKSQDRPTLRKYFDVMRDWTNYKGIRPTDGGSPGQASNTSSNSPDTIPAPPTKADVAAGGPGPRVADSVKNIGNNLTKNTFSADLPGADVMSSISGGFDGMTGVFDSFNTDMFSNLGGLSDLGGLSNITDVMGGGIGTMTNGLKSFTDVAGNLGNLTAGVQLGNLTGVSATLSGMTDSVGKITAGFGTVTGQIGNVQGVISLIGSNPFSSNPLQQGILGNCFNTSKTLTDQIPVLSGNLGNNLESNLNNIKSVVQLNVNTNGIATSVNTDFDLLNVNVSTYHSDLTDRINNAHPNISTKLQSALSLMSNSTINSQNEMTNQLSSMKSLLSSLPSTGPTTQQLNDVMAAISILQAVANQYSNEVGVKINNFTAANVLLNSSMAHANNFKTNEEIEVKGIVSSSKALIKSADNAVDPARDAIASFLV